jgi:chromosome condensin MukBEF ATPase and DNA-binding subunit MukB
VELERAAAEAEANQLEQAGGHFPDDLLRARDRVEGELLAGFFEDVEASDAARQQAMLGPLHEAILVDDAAMAAELLTRAC